MTDKEKPKAKRGFAAMSPEKQREISSKGGKAAPNNFKNNKAFAQEAGRRRWKNKDVGNTV